jgi:hypothetical protein
MLPRGLTAQPAERHVQRRLHALHPDAQTVACLLVGACSCDLVRPRHADPLEDERRHRAHRHRAGAAREALLASLERHRRGAQVPAPRGGWPRALAGFVAEHARNAGETLYLLTFEGTGAGPAEPEPARPRRMTAAEVVSLPDHWLQERHPVLVTP